MGARDFKEYFNNLRNHTAEVYLPGGGPLPKNCEGYGMHNRENAQCKYCHAAWACFSLRIGIWNEDRTKHDVPTYRWLRQNADFPENVPPPLGSQSPMSIGMIGFDWLPNVTTHPCHRQLAMTVHAAGEAGFNIHRILMVEDIDYCDVIIVPMLVTKCDHRVVSKLMHYYSYKWHKHHPKIVCYHIDPRPRPVEPLGIRNFDAADAMFYTCIGNRYLDTDVPIVTMPWGTYYEPKEHTDSNNTTRISITATAGTDAKREIHNNQYLPGYRLHYIFEIAKAVNPRTVDLYGMGWDKVNMPGNVQKMGWQYGTSIYSAYGAVIDIVEDDYVEDWNSIGYWSDRPVLAMEQGTHTITTLPWLVSQFESCYSVSDLLLYGKFDYNFAAIKKDAEKMQFKNFVPKRMQEMLDILFKGKTMQPVGPKDINRKWTPSATDLFNRCDRK